VVHGHVGDSLVYDAPVVQSMGGALMGGRIPKPTNLKLLHGNPGKRPLNTREPKPRVEIPTPPAHLNDLAKAEWDRLAPKLAQLGLISELDRAALATYCCAYARWVEAEQAMSKTGPVIRYPNGSPGFSPYWTVSNKAVEQMKSILTEFGLTPASRTRLNVTPHEEDPFDNWLGRA
jgi:P27 family predicted phage terminase small subunit